MTTKLPGYEDTVICPYNKCHVILKHRFQTHLMKCAKANPHMNLETCPFDVTHRCRSEDMKKHKEDCPSRGNFDRYVYSIADSNASGSGNEKPQEMSARSLPPQKHGSDEEDWDHYDTPTYDPQRYAMSANVLRAPVALTKSERRKFADAERKRISGLGTPANNHFQNN